MTWDDEFFESRRLTSKLKHYVLRRYVKEFAYHLGPSTTLTVSRVRVSTEPARIAKPDLQS